MTLAKPHTSKLLRWGTDSDLENMAARAKMRPDTPGLGFARKMHEKTCEEKSHARGRVKHLFTPQEHPGVLRILTMPGPFWTFERALLKSRKSINLGNKQHTFIYSIEREGPIFALSLARLPGAHIRVRHHPEEGQGYAAAVLETPKIERYYCCSFEDFSKHNTTRFDAAWLDFTGPLTTDLLTAIPHFWARIEKTLVVTGLNARWSTTVGRQLARRGGPHTLLQTLCQGATIVDVHDYVDGVPMFQVALTREQHGLPSR